MYLPKRFVSLVLAACIVLTLCAPAMVRAEETETSPYAAVNYDLYYEELNYTTNGITSLLSQSATLTPLYESGAINFLPYAKSSAITPYFYSSAADTSSPYGYNGVLLQSGAVGDWLAFKIKSPGTGTFEVALDFYYNNAHCALDYGVYILPASTATADIANALSENYLIGTVSVQSSGYAAATSYSAVVCSDFVSTDDAQEYVLVIKANADNATANARIDMMLEGISMTELPPPVVDYPLYYDALSYTTNGLAALLSQSATLSPLYENGTINFLPYAKSSTKTPYFYSSAADTSSPYGYDGVLLQSGAVGDWLAFKIKNPGADTYEISLNYYYNNVHCALDYGVYILPANTAAADIADALSQDTLLGIASVTSDGRSSATAYSTAVSGRFVTDADASEYIIVLKAEADNSTANARVDMMLEGISMTREGHIDTSFGPFESQIASENAVRSASFYKATTGVNPANGHDYLYLLFKGSTMWVYDLDTQQPVQIVESASLLPGTPFGSCFDSDGNLWICGSGKYLYKYDPTTGSMSKVTLDDTLFDGINNVYGITYYNGKFYFGTSSYGHLGTYDPVTGVTAEISDWLNTSQTLEPDAYHAAYGGIQIVDGYLYTTIDGDRNEDQVQTHQIIKYDLANEQIVDFVDVASIVGNVTGIGNLAYVDGLLIATMSSQTSPAMIIDITGQTMEMTTINGLTGSFINKVSNEYDGKVYATGYVNGTRTLYVYDTATGTATPLDITAYASLLCDNSIVTITGDDRLPGISIVAPRNNSETGRIDVYLYNPQTQETVIITDFIPGQGTGNALRAITTDPTGRYIFTGAYGNNQIAMYDIQTGETTVMPGYGHQTDSLTWYGDYLWVGNYNKGTITRYDVENATPAPLFNLMDSVFQQKRMLSISAGGNKVFCGTIPDTGMYGGALAWYDITLDRTYVAAGPNPQDVYYADTTDVTAYVWYNAVTNQVETFDADGDGDYDTYITVDGQLQQRFYGVIENQCINCTIYKDGYIIGSTTKANGMGESADATEGNATIFVYDVANMRVVATCDLTQAISGLTGPIDLVNTVAEDPYEAGKFWGIVSDTLFSFTFDAQTQTISATEELSFGKENYWAGPAVWGHTSILFDGEYLYAAFGSMGTYMVNTEDPTENYRLTAHPADQMVQGMDGELYYIDNVSNHILRLPIAQSAQPLVAASVQDVIDALPAASQITLADQAAVAAARAMYEDLIAETKTQIDITALLAAEAALEAL